MWYYSISIVLFAPTVTLCFEQFYAFFVHEIKHMCWGTDLNNVYVMLLNGNLSNTRTVELKRWEGKLKYTHRLQISGMLGINLLHLMSNSVHTTLTEEKTTST